MFKKVIKSLALTVLICMVLVQYVFAYSLVESKTVTYDNGTLYYDLEVSDNFMEASSWYSKEDNGATVYVTCTTYQFKINQPTIVIDYIDSHSANAITGVAANVHRTVDEGYQFYHAYSTHKVSNSSGYIEKTLP